MVVRATRRHHLLVGQLLPGYYRVAASVESKTDWSRRNEPLPLNILKFVCELLVAYHISNVLIPRFGQSTTNQFELRLPTRVRALTLHRS